MTPYDGINAPRVLDHHVCTQVNPGMQPSLLVEAEFCRCGELEVECVFSLMAGRT